MDRGSTKLPDGDLKSDARTQRRLLKDHDKVLPGKRLMGNSALNRSGGEQICKFFSRKLRH
jgi:hypothetical protein